MGGGYTTLKSGSVAIKKNIPLLVFAGSGGAADFIGAAYDKPLVFFYELYIELCPKNLSFVLPRDVIHCRARYYHGNSSVCLTVSLRYCGHIVLHTSKITSPLGSSLSADPTLWIV